MNTTERKFDKLAKYSFTNIRYNEQYGTRYTISSCLSAAITYLVGSTYNIFENTLNPEIILKIC